MPLPPEHLQDVERRLRTARDELAAALHARLDGDAPDIAPATHIEQNEDRAQAEMISHNEEHFAGHESDLLHQIDAALGRLEAGSYGICMSCGREIAQARLLATPTVQTCIECQEQIEKDEHRGRGPTM